MVVATLGDVLEGAEGVEAGNSGAGSRLPSASSQSELGPGRIRMPWSVHTGEWFAIPSG